jgi:hypothetical protein
VEHLGGDGFWPALAAFLRYVAAFDSWVAMVFRAGQSPEASVGWVSAALPIASSDEIPVGNADIVAIDHSRATHGDAKQNVSSVRS